MHFFIRAFAAFAILVSLWAPASAESLEARANTVNPVGIFYFHTSLGYGCFSAGRGKVRINQPEHGTVKTEWRKLKMNSAGGCKGRPGLGLAVWYIPHKGFTGKDKFSFTLTVPGLAPGVGYSSAKHWTYKVNVK